MFITILTMIGFIIIFLVKAVCMIYGYNLLAPYIHWRKLPYEQETIVGLAVILMVIK